MSPPIWLVLTALCIIPPLALVCYYSLDLSGLKPAEEGKALPEMEISEIYIYPIKSLRALKLASATATAHGFAHDRSFMLLEKTPASASGYKIMAVSTHSHMTQFLQEISTDPSTGSGKITVRYLACGDTSKQSSLEIPLVPSTKSLEMREVDMYGSSTLAYRMPRSYNEWFTTCFGFDVELIYLGSHRRSPRFSDMSSSPSSSLSSSSPSSSLPSILKRLLSPQLPSPLGTQTLTFTDCAPYLFCTTASLSSVSARLPPSAGPVDVTKFRPNIVLAGAKDAWQEDYWGAIAVREQSTNKKIDVLLPHNCVRCTSVNLDYATGKPGVGPTGEVLKRLQGDRRVDAGAKWSPVFGRYGFWKEDKAGEEVVWSVGDKVSVTRVNKERTVWSWPGLG